MRAGNLDKVITIERAVTTLDGLRAPVEVWTALATVRAQVIQSSTEEFIRSRGASSETVVIFRTRYLAGVTLADRIVFEGAAFNIKEAKELGRRRGLELRAERLAS